MPFYTVQFGGIIIGAMKWNSKEPASQFLMLEREANNGKIIKKRRKRRKRERIGKVGFLGMFIFDLLSQVLGFALLYKCSFAFIIISMLSWPFYVSVSSEHTCMYHRTTCDLEFYDFKFRRPLNSAGFSAAFYLRRKFYATSPAYDADIPCHLIDT